MNKEFQESKLTVDMVVFALVGNDLKVLLIKRRDMPFKNRWALPGGYVDIGKGEVPDVAAARELQEETSVDANDAHMEQMHTFAGPKRDPRGYTTTVSYFVILPSDRTDDVEAGEDAKEAEWFFINEPEEEEDKKMWIGSLKLAFDHNQIYNMGLSLLKKKLDQNNKLVFAFLPSKCTQKQILGVFTSLRQRSYSRQSLTIRIYKWVSEGVLTDTGGSLPIARGRPQKLYTVSRDYLETI